MILKEIWNRIIIEIWSIIPTNLESIKTSIIGRKLAKNKLWSIIELGLLLGKLAYKFVVNLISANLAIFPNNKM